MNLSVPANTMWMDTSVSLAAGESASISATGNISYGSGLPACQGIPIPPDGCSAESGPVSGPAGALIGRVGNGASLIVGRSATVTGPGTIALGINDWATELGNNTGSFAVTITRNAKPLSPNLPPATEPNARLFSSESAKTGKTKYSGVTVTRNGQRYRVTANASLQTGDIITTDGDTVLAIEFGVGGRVGLSRNSSIRILGDRHIEGIGGTTTASPDSRPLQIQTNGGTIGIRG